jgi:ribosomal-protein-alanine N-acetyltransferase
VILSAGVEHAAVMAAVHGAAFAEEPWGAENFAVLLGQPGVFGFVDERGGICLLRVVADEAEILTIGVAVPRQGIGRALMAAALAQARARQVARVFLEVAAGNAAARGLYERLGFAQVGRRKAYYADGQDALVLAVELRN